MPYFCLWRTEMGASGAVSGMLRQLFCHDPAITFVRCL
jgi:hypothetical protein